MPLAKPDYSFRRMLRANRLLSELGHTDNNAALAELKALRIENQKLRATVPPRPADNRNREQESWDHRFGFLANPMPMPPAPKPAHKLRVTVDIDGERRVFTAHYIAGMGWAGHSGNTITKAIRLVMANA